MKLKIRITFGVLIYLLGILQMGIPFLFPFAYNTPSQVSLMLSGTFITVASIFCNYEMGLLKLISFKEQLMVTTIVGLFLMLSPVVLGFYEQGFVLHFSLGLLIAGSASAIYKTTFVRHRPRLQYSMR